MSREAKTLALRASACVFDAVRLFLGAVLIAVILTSCSPYAATPAATATAAPSVTATAGVLPIGNKSATATPQTCTVTGYLNFRTRPSRSARVIAVLEAGERVRVIESGTWHKVTTRNATGFIYSAFCK